MEKVKRLSWEEYALKLAFTASQRSEDPYVKVGACCLRHDNSVASVGYNGSPSGVEIDWSDRDNRRCRAIHAEVNSLRYVKPNECRLIASTLLPCRNCIVLIASYKIPIVVFSDIYERDDKAFELAEEFGIELLRINLN